VKDLGPFHHPAGNQEKGHSISLVRKIGTGKGKGENFSSTDKLFHCPKTPEGGGEYSASLKHPDVTESSEKRLERKETIGRQYNIP